jgi:hypothetical protein
MNMLPPRPARLQIGDRVQTVRLLTLLPEGSVGTMRRIYNVQNLCAVAFDRHPKVRILPLSVLALVQKASEASAE